MVRIVGHGILSRFTSQISIERPLPLKCLLKRAGIEKEWWEDIVFVRDSFRIDVNEEIKDGDEIHLFVAMCGG
ncbi:MAG: hypothetical protein H5T91_00625 [Synergistetes bacterium]|nr:MAG: hypothetical protein XD52_0455 [bacterium 42_11]MBC7330921.1 hypothetical protein [Synergistota bacterium]MDK2870882.1 hypothetical protein [bacterium]